MKRQEVKLFGNQKVRTVWDDEAEEWFFSIIDVVAVLTESKNPATYWKVLKNRLKKEGNETVTNCNQLKLQAADGKMRLTDVATPEQMFRIIIQGSGVMLTIPEFSDDLLTNSSENKGVSSESTGASLEKMKVGEQVLTMIAADASVTQMAIARKLHCPRSTVAYWFKKFTDEGKIVRKGPDKGGLWLVKE